MSYKAGTVVIDIKADTAKLVTGMQKAEKSVGKAVENIKNTVFTLVSAYAGLQTAQKLVGDGFRYNMKLEEAKAGLTSLSVAVQDKTIPVMERYARANKEATATLIKLQEINAQTPHTLDQTNQIYKAMYVSMKNAGASTSDMIELTRSISIAAGAGGIAFNSLLAGVDGLATGTVLANSDLGRFISSLGLTNEALKNSDDVVGLLKENLKDFKAADLMSVALSNLENSWNTLSGELTKDIFKDTKDTINEFSTLLNDNKDDILEVADTIADVSKVVAIMGGSILVVNTATKAYVSVAAIATTANTLMGGSFGAVNRSIMLATISTRALSLATKSIPFVAVASGIALLIKSLNDSARASDELEASLTNTGKALGELTKAELEYRKQVLLSSYQDAKIKAFELLRDTQRQGFMESKLEQAEDLKNYELANQKVLDISNAYDEVTKALLEYKDEATKSFNSQIKEWDDMEAELLSFSTTKKELTEEQKKLEKERQEAENALYAMGFQIYNQYIDDKISKHSEFDSHVEKFYARQDALQKAATDLITSDTEKINARYLKMYDVIDEVFDEDQMKKFLKSWEDSLADVNKEASKYDGIGSQGWTAGLKGQAKDFANVSNAVQDLTKDQGKYNKLSEEDKALNKDAYIESQANGYAALAGAMSGVFEECSSGAKAFQGIQATLGIVNAYTGIAAAWASAAFPANIPAVAAASASLLPIIATLGSLGGSGGGSGGGGSSSPYSMPELATAKVTELEDQTAIDLMQQQVTLLEAIEKNGSAQKLSVDLAESEFTQAKNEWVQDIFDESRMGWQNAMFSKDKTDETGAYLGDSDMWTDIKTHYENLGTINPFDMSGSDIKIDSSLVRQNVDDFITIIADMATFTKGEGYSYTGPIAQEMAEDIGFSNEAHQAFLAKIKSSFSEIQGYLNDWATSVVDSVSELNDSADDFKGFYDDITGTTKYADIAIKEAYANVEKLKKTGESTADVLVRSINQIEKSSGFIEEFSGVIDENGKELTNYELLLSKDGDLIEEQMLKVSKFSEVTGEAFSNGVKEAIDYADSIEIVKEAMKRSRENIDSWVQRNETLDETAQRLADTLGVSLNVSANELMGGIDGLTDAELEFLQAREAAQKDALESQEDSLESQKDALDEYLSEITNDIQGLESVIDSLSNIIDKLRDAASGSDTTLQRYYASMQETQALSSSMTDEAFKESLTKTIGLSSSLFDDKNFGFSRDQKFAQAVAANQFEAMEAQSFEQIDYLRMIEENTKDTAERMISLLQEISDTIEYDSVSSGVQEAYESEYSGVQNSNEAVLQEAYESILGRQVDDEGLEYYSGWLAQGKSISDVTKSLQNSNEAYVTVYIQKLEQVLIMQQCHIGEKRWMQDKAKKT